MDHYLRADISASAIRHNINLIRGLLSQSTGLCPVVKADAYSHSLERILGLIAPSADMLAVATGSEAIDLRELGWDKPVLVLATAAANAEGMVELIVNDITLTVTNSAELPLLVDSAERAGREATVHIKIDTGMTRSGISAEKAGGLVRAIRESKQVKLAGIYTHFACADDADKSPTGEQFRRFMSAVKDCGGREGLTLHTANSAATIDMPETHLDMVRTGLAVYGCQPSDEMHNILPLKPALRLVGPIVQIKDVRAGDATGYGLTYKFSRDARIAVVPIGYADGYPRCLSNVASMRWRDIECPIRGRISMDQTVIEITSATGAQIGDDVEIISNDSSAVNSAENLARQAETIPYEILSRLGRRINRVLAE